MSEHKSNDKWLAGLLFAAIVVVPVLLSAVTVPVAFERGKSREFCASCHVMTPYIEGLDDPTRELLSAKHYQNKWINDNQCFTCHSDYGFFGEMKAKVNGMRHMAAYYSNSKKPVKLYHPYKNANCLHCHETTPKYKDQPAHADILETLKNEEMSCIDCHGPVHPSGVKK